MKHKVSKFKIKSGQDANQMLLKKLVRNFVRDGHITTSMTKASYLVATLQHLAGEALANKNSTDNELKAFFGDDKGVLSFKGIVSTHKNSPNGSGIVKMLKLGARKGDGVETAKVVWSKSEIKPSALDKSKEVEVNDAKS